ncbi:DUF456 domain-containing protein [Isoptericola sp. NEAU-Y5]|uniref:DUF456 domain-containing protein n=1 Tax=Isoptericola luteus TaxID=2879484 RepID=A0ABS7ZBZ5_9MICO|nr:DUF456 domain-containing protein [Isoptericola sp. NEAU-Y5]MCA5892571.1 DUF456 domain-containing protein [Isoptericola sp. NEAU-Y5]
MSLLGEVLVGLGIAVGLVGIVVQVLPGNVLVLGSVLVWAWVTGGPTAWTCFAVAAVAIVLAELGQWLLAGKHMRRADVPWSTLALAGVAGLVGFFVVPVVGLFLFFAGAVYLVELSRRRDGRAAWRATVAALQATAITIGVQLAGGLVATLAWVAGLILT